MNTFLGLSAGTNITSGNSNVLVGFGAGDSATTGGEITAVGKNCANLMNVGRGCYYGAGCAEFGTVTSGTCGYGFNSLQNLSGSTGNTCAYGFESLQLCTSGGGNSAYGSLSLTSLINGSINTAVGRFAGTNMISGSGNLYLGDSAGISHVEGETDNICIANNGIVGENTTIHLGKLATHTSCFIAGISSVTPAGNTQNVIIDTTTGELGTAGTSPDATGVISGGFLTIDVDTTKFSISDGNGIIYDPVTAVKQLVTWSGLTAQSFVYVGDESFISIDSAGFMISSPTLPTNSEIRDDIYLGQIVHLDQTHIILVLYVERHILSG